MTDSTTLLWLYEQFTTLTQGIENAPETDVGASGRSHLIAARQRIQRLIGLEEPADAPALDMPIEEILAVAVELVAAQPRAIGVDGSALRQAIIDQLRVQIPQASGAMDRAVELGQLRKIPCHRRTQPGCEICEGRGIKPHHLRWHYLLAASDPAADLSA